MDMSIAQKVETLIGQRNDILEEIEHLRLALSAEVDPAEDEADPEIVEREKTLAVLELLKESLMRLTWRFEPPKQAPTVSARSVVSPLIRRD